MTTFTKDKNSGFTLVEMLTAVAVFTVIMSISMGSIVGVFDTNRKARTMRSVIGNLNIAMESMSREIKFGTNYHCGTQRPITVPLNCSIDGASFFSFLSNEDLQVVYRSNGTVIEKSTDGGSSYVPVTAPEMSVDSLVFYTTGAGTGNTLQPKTLIKVEGHAGAGEDRTDFVLQTLVSQRELDR